MAEAIVSLFVERFGDFILREARSFSKSSNYKKFQRLERELKRMQCFLKDADTKQDQNERLRQKIAEIRDLIYDADNIFDKYDIKIASKKKESSRRFKFLFSESRTMRKLGSQIDDITERVNELITSLQAYGIEELKGGDQGNNNSSKEKQQQLRRTYSHVVEENIVGLEEQTLKLLEQLLGDERSSHVVSICGMGGLGKTTLAKNLYHHPKVRCHFNRFAWACISQQWDARQVWEGILIRLNCPDSKERDRISKLQDDELAKELYQVQLKTKCLIVLDDIWTEYAWDSLRAGFPEGNTSSKILLTSRNIEVAQHVDPRGFIHQPRHLNELESWELFERTAIHGREETGFVFDKCIEELGHAMLKHCGGLPLAIKVLGGIMATKHTIDEWKRVHDDVQIHIRGKDQVKEIFHLSYNDLPYHLKPCFLSFSHYREDDIIKRKELNQIWMAEGFIPSSRPNEEVKEMENIAEESLEQLVLRCMVQVDRRGSRGKIHACKIHDIMRDLCIQQAQKEGFVHFLHNNESCVSLGKVHRLVLRNDSYENVEVGNERYAHTRSLIAHLSSNTNIGGLMVHRFKFLRVLILKNVQSPIPNGIGELFHLRHLELYYAFFGSIPPSIGNLSLLLTLKLGRCFCKEILNDIVKLKRLQHLYLDLCPHFPRGKLELANLSSLQTLVWPVGYLHPEELATLSSLKKLKIGVEYRWPMIFNSFSGNTFNNLYSLSVTGSGICIEIVDLCCPNLRKLYIDGTIYLWGADIDNHHSHFFQNLAKLELENSYLFKDPMPLLGKLPNLKFLLLRNVLECDTMICPQHSFPRLETLLLSHFYKVGEWIIEEEALQCLRELTILDCFKHKAMPDGLRFINGLKELKIHSASDELKDRIKKGGEDFYKIEHIVSIIINY